MELHSLIEPQILELYIKLYTNKQTNKQKPSDFQNSMGSYMPSCPIIKKLLRIEIFYSLTDDDRCSLYRQEN